MKNVCIHRYTLGIRIIKKIYRSNMLFNFRKEKKPLAFKDIKLLKYLQETLQIHRKSEDKYEKQKEAVIERLDQKRKILKKN